MTFYCRVFVLRDRISTNLQRKGDFFSITSGEKNYELTKSYELDFGCEKSLEFSRDTIAKVEVWSYEVLP